MNASAATLLAELLHRGVELEVSGDRLRYRPTHVVDAALRRSLVEHRRSLLSLVCYMSVAPLPAGTWGRCASALLARVSHDGERAALRERFEERAAICQFDGKLSVDEAERMAFMQLCRTVVPAGRAGAGEALQDEQSTFGKRGPGA